MDKEASKDEGNYEEIKQQLVEDKEKQNASEQISLQHIMELREAFDAAKKHKDGALELEEFMDAFGGIIGRDMNDKQI
jgi:Ca2+-binding EF-hand superfamily protein